MISHRIRHITTTFMYLCENCNSTFATPNEPLDDHPLTCPKCGYKDHPCPNCGRTLREDEKSCLTIHTGGREDYKYNE